MEVWKDIPGYKGFYKVSDKGRVLSVERKAKIKNGFFRRVSKRILKQRFDKDGYYFLNLNKNGKHKPCLVHTLIAMAFLNHKPDGLTIVVDHIDNNKNNNCLDNLQLITHRENVSKDLKNTKSKYTGVSKGKNKKKWLAYYKKNGLQKYIGSFDDELSAHHAYLKAVSEIKINDVND